MLPDGRMIVERQKTRSEPNVGVDRKGTITIFDLFYVPMIWYDTPDLGIAQQCMHEVTSSGCPVVKITAADKLACVCLMVTSRILEVVPDFRHECVQSGFSGRQNSHLNFQSPSCYV